MPVGTVQLVTKADYARMRGCTEGAVRRAVRDGRISLIDGRIDPVAADAQWARNTRVRLGSRPGAADDGDERERPERSSGEDDADGYWQSRRRREQAEAELAELKLAELRGMLVRQDQVRASLSRRFASLREAFLQMPARVVPLLAAQPEPASMDKVLRDEITAVLAQLTTEAADGRA
jgi:hypothetical protein